MKSTQAVVPSADTHTIGRAPDAYHTAAGNSLCNQFALQGKFSRVFAGIQTFGVPVHNCSIHHTCREFSATAHCTSQGALVSTDSYLLNHTLDMT